MPVLVDAPLPRRARIALTALRMVPALMMIIHGSYRLADRGVGGFGQYLLEQHVPLGPVVAWVITVVEVGGGLALATGNLVVPLSIWFAIELTTGIIMVHSHDGWFVVGAGRNGMEYSFVLVSCHIINANIAWALRKQSSAS